MNTWVIEAEILGTRTVSLQARSYNDALSKFQNKEYDSQCCEDDYNVDHILSITERVD